MTLRAKIPHGQGKSGRTLSRVNLIQDVERITGLGLKHAIFPLTAVSSGGVVTCNDLVTGAQVQSSLTLPPVIDTAINGKPTLTHGSGASGSIGQIMRATKESDLDLGTGAWSIAMLVRAMGLGSADYLLGYVPGALTTASDYSPVLRFVLGGSVNLAATLLSNSLAAKSIIITEEFYDTNRLLVITHTPTVSTRWFVDDWSAPKKTDTTSAAKAALTDGRFVIGSLSNGVGSLNFAGSYAWMGFHNVDLGDDDDGRKQYMQALAAYAGITSN